MDETLKKFEEFFKRDLNIKKLLIEAGDRGISDDVEYLDQLDEAFENIEYEFSKMQDDGIIGEMFKQKIDEKLKEIKSKLRRSE